MNLIKLKLYEILRKCAAKNRSFPMWNIKWSQFRFKRLSARRNFCEMRNQTRIFFILVTQDATCTSKRRRQYQLEFPLKKWQTKAIHFFFASKFTSVWYHPRAKLSFPRFADHHWYLASPCLSFTFKLYHYFHHVHNIQENVPMNNQKSYHFYDYFFSRALYAPSDILSHNHYGPKCF